MFGRSMRFTDEIRKALKLPITFDSRLLYTNMTAGAVLFTVNFDYS